MKRSLAAIIAIAMLLTLWAGCSASGAGTAAPQTPAPTAPAEAAAPTEAAPAPVELHISAAASLADAVAELQTLYAKAAPHVTLTCTFDSSGTLQTQIEEGAPADVFISAAQKQMNALEEKNLIIADTRMDLLENKVVMIVPSGAEASVTSFEDAAADTVSMIAIGDETVPVGQYTQEIYTSLGLWDAVKAKANLGTNVRAVLTWVENGEVDCGIVYATDAAISDKVTVVCEAPAGSHQPVIYPAAVVASSENPEEAQAFLDFLSTPEAAAVFEGMGFTVCA